MTSVWIAEPCVNGLMPCATPSALVCTISCRLYFCVICARSSYIALNFQSVSTCSSGNGGGAG